MYNIRRTFRKVYLLRKIYINEHSESVGADLSRPTIIKKKHIQTPQNVAYKIFNKHTAKRVINNIQRISRPHIIKKYIAVR